MEFKKLILNLKPEDIDFLIAKLINIDIDQFEIEDKNEFEEFIKTKSKYWDYIDENLIKSYNESKIIIYLQKNNLGEKNFKNIKSLIKNLNKEGYDIKIQTKTVKEEDWENNWKEYFKTFKIGKSFIIKPSWEEYSKQSSEEKIINIDPKSSFGTGKHETTKLCIIEIERLVKKNDIVLDVGCGSAILSIASLLMGAKEVSALDIDENSIKIANENININNFKKQFNAYVGDISKNKNLFNEINKQKYDIILANIVADVIINMKDVFSKLIKPNGYIIISGIIDERACEVEKNMSKLNFEIVNKTIENDWVCLVMRKKSSNV